MSIIEERDGYRLVIEDDTVQIDPDFSVVDDEIDVYRYRSAHPVALESLYREVADEFSTQADEYGAAGIQFVFDDETVPATDEYFKEAIAGEKGGDAVGSILRGRREVLGDEEHDGYHWQKQWRLSPDTVEDLPQTKESTWIGWDVKITPDGEPYIIEFHEEGGFGTKGFADAFQYGSLGRDDTARPEDTLDISTLYYTIRHAAYNKKSSHDVLTDLMPERFREPADADGEEVVVVKPSTGACGVDVFLKEGEDIVDSLWDSFDLVEEYVGSKPVTYDGDEFDGCMRYVQRLDLDEEGLTVTDFGGYWRTPPEPVGADVESIDARHIANLSWDGNAVPASYDDLATAADVALEGVERLYRAWLGRRLHRDPDMFGAEIERSEYER